jgi:hypothetical protein
MFPILAILPTIGVFTLLGYKIKRKDQQNNTHAHIDHINTSISPFAFGHFRITRRDTLRQIAPQ